MTANVFGDLWSAIIAALNWLLQLFYRGVGNYGVAIILLTIVVKLVLIPLTLKQTRSMMALQKIQPEIKKLQEKYKDDKERLSQEMMKFYREHKVNPFSGCLPLVIQLPVFIALYTVLRKYIMTSPVLLLGNVVRAGLPDSSRLLAQGSLIKSANFLWIHNLADSTRVADKTFILIIFLMASTWFSQRQVVTDPRQKNMSIFMAAFMGLIAMTLPAGVVLYWVVTNVLQIIQQVIIERAEKRREIKEEAKKAAKRPEKKPAAIAGRGKTPAKGKKQAPQRGASAKKGRKPLPKTPPPGRRRPPPKKK